MEIRKNCNVEYAVGILWNMSNKYARDIMLKIAIMEEVIQVMVLNLEDYYRQFVLDCYDGDEEAYNGGYIYEKIKNMNSSSNKIVAFVFQIKNPTYKIDENGKMQCIESRKVKQRIREEYAPQMDNYFFDNLIHISDNMEEARHTLLTLNKYKNRTTENYVRKGYKPIIEIQTDNQRKTYTSILKKLKEINNER